MVRQRFARARLRVETIVMSIIEFGDTQLVSMSSLSRREQIILARLGDEITFDQLAQSLYVSRNTLKSQVRTLYRKLGVTSRADAVDWATRRLVLA
jgi:DNA-binding CsgD family transcriptional regulator